jgi:hypothetical protein
MNPRSTQTWELLRDARRNLAQIEELHGVVGRLIRETSALLASIDDAGEPPHDNEHPFHRKG